MPEDYFKFNFNIDSQLLKAIKKEAYEKDISNSEAVRRILKNYFNLG